MRSFNMKPLPKWNREIRPMRTLDSRLGLSLRPRRKHIPEFKLFKRKQCTGARTHSCGGYRSR